MRYGKLKPNVVPFLQNASYYFQKGNQYYQQNKLQKALIFFKKSTEVEPENPIHHYNLACLLSRMGYLEKANQVFAYIVNKMDPSLTECFFLMAVNYGLTDDLEQARYYLNLYLQCSPDGEMAVDAEELLFVLTEEEVELRLDDGEGAPSASYKQREYSPSEKTFLERYKTSIEVQRALWMDLYREETELVEKAIYLLGLVTDNDASKKTLLEFVRNPWVHQRLRLQALLRLKNLGFHKPVPVFMDGCQLEVDLACYPLLAGRWHETWQEVLDVAMQNMRASVSYSEQFYEDLQAIWIDFLNNIYPRTPGISKVETWAAGLEYALARYHFLNLTQKTLARQYGISVSSVSLRYREIDRALNIEHRSYHNMLRYLTQRENDADD